MLYNCTHVATVGVKGLTHLFHCRASCGRWSSVVHTWLQPWSYTLYHSRQYSTSETVE